MGEKTGGLTNMIIAVVMLVAILIVVDIAFPSLTESITAKMQDIVNNTFVSYTPSDGVIR